MSAVLIAETSAPAPVAFLLTSLRALGISVPRPGEVRSYLTRHSDVIELAEQVCACAAAEFAGSAALSLEVYADPEIDDQYLMLYVQQQHCGQATWDKIERIRESYELDLADLSGWFHVTADFRNSERR